MEAAETGNLEIRKDKRMARFSNETLSSYTHPVSGSEDETIQNVVNMVCDAINASDDLKDLDIEVFLQGSYANNTNVRLNSDVDINVCLKTTFFYQLPEGRRAENYGITPPTNNYADYKASVLKALVAKFGKDNVKPKNKCIHIKDNTYHHEADVVPTFEYREYGYFNVDRVGVKFITDKGIRIENYPKQQIENGTEKNIRTGHRYKRTTRVLKRIRYKMQEEQVTINENVSSFLIESLLWNVPDELFEEADLNVRLNNILVYLFNKTVGENSMSNWNEESNILPLFSNDRKWKTGDVIEFLIQVKRYLGYDNE